MFHWIKSEEQYWGYQFPIFNIFKDGRKWFLAYIPRPTPKNGPSQARYIQVKSVQQAKMIARKILKAEMGGDKDERRRQLRGLWREP